MARKRKLPDYVTAVVDRHGKERFRYRRKGLDFYLKEISSSEAKEILRKANEGIAPRKERLQPKTIGDLCQRFYASARFNKASEPWRKLAKASLEEFRNEALDVPVSDFTDYHIEKIVIRRGEKRLVNGRTVGGPAAAARLHEQLIRLFDFAHKKLRWIDVNPAREADKLFDSKGPGYHTWTEAEIAKFQAKHTLGTRARLAMEIALWTGLRRGDIAKLGPSNISEGRVTALAGKTGKSVDVLLAPDLKAAIDAMPSVSETFLVTSQGKPFTGAGLGNWFRERCDEAGLPNCSIHGLRKALTKRAAEADATQQQLKALGQWANDSEVATYAAAANQRKLADAAIQRVIQARTLSNPLEKVDK
jgi:integrase